MIIAIVFALAALGLVSAVLTVAGAFIAGRLGIVDRPDGARKLHTEAVPLWGGVPIFLTFWLAVGIIYFYFPIFGIRNLANGLGGLFFGSLILLFIGIADDVKPFSPIFRLVLIGLGLAVAAYFMPLYKLTNPRGGIVFLSAVTGTLVVFAWLLVTTISTKILDGVDGLAGSVVGVGALTIVLLTLNPKFYQPNVALVAGIFLAVLMGFLVFNWPRASVFLGESGSLFIGFTLGGLAIMAGSKMATALLVMAVPVLDLARVAYLRLRSKQPIFTGDRLHLHYVLIDRGWKEWQVLLFLVGVALIAGVIGLWLQSYQKLLALLILALGFLLFVSGLGLGLVKKQ